MMDRQGLEGETYPGEYQQGDPNNREDLNGDLNARGEPSREDLSRGELCNLVVFHPTSNNCHTGELVAANTNNNNNNNLQVENTVMLPNDIASTFVIKRNTRRVVQGVLLKFHFYGAAQVP